MWISGSVLPAARHRKVTAWARVQMPSGEKWVAPVGSLRNAVFHRPIHGVLIIVAGGYIHKHAGLGVAVGLHKDDLNGMGSADILKGIGIHRADALAVDFDIGDGIALIRGDGKGLISALADADIAGGRD